MAPYSAGATTVTGKYSGRQPAITALIATFSTVTARLRRRTHDDVVARRPPAARNSRPAPPSAARREPIGPALGVAELDRVVGVVDRVDTRATSCVSQRGGASIPRVYHSPRSFRSVTPPGRGAGRGRDRLVLPDPVAEVPAPDQRRCPPVDGPARRMNAGTSVARIRNASTSTASASPRPNSLSCTTSDVVSPRNTIVSSSAAAVTMCPVLPQADRDRRARCRGRSRTPP